MKILLVIAWNVFELLCAAIGFYILIIIIFSSTPNSGSCAYVKINTFEIGKPCQESNDGIK